jgi:hypothetical protein
MKLLLVVWKGSPQTPAHCISALYTLSRLSVSGTAVVSVQGGCTAVVDCQAAARAAWSCCGLDGQHASCSTLITFYFLN